MKISASFSLNNRLYVITSKGYAYVLFEKNSKQVIKRISIQHFENKRAEKYNY